LRIHQISCGPDSHETTEDLAHLAASLEQSGDLDGAAEQYERALKLKERQVGADLDQVADMQVSVARMYIRWGRLGPARELLSQAIGSLESRKGQRLASALEVMAQAEEAFGRPRDAESLRERALRIAASTLT